MNLTRYLKQLVSPFRRRWVVTSGGTLAVAIALLWFVHHARADVGHNTGQGALPTIAVAKVSREDLYREVTIPAEFRPYQEVELHAKVSGYVDKMNVDFGERVKAGQLLATLEVPELLDELHNAIGTERRAEADAADAHLIYSRLLSVNKTQPNLISQQDLDTAEAKDRAAAAALDAAQADVQKYQTLVGYTSIVAPFDGVVTARYADPGALIQAGTSSDTQSKPLVRVSDNYRLRLDFPVSVDYVKDIHPGDAVEVRVESLGGESFAGTISRFTGKVTETTRTMTSEMEVSNPNLEIVPGMYATVVLKVDKRPQALAVPIEAVALGAKSTVLVVNANHEIEQRAVTLGIETPAKYEVLSGLQEGDLVMIGHPSGVQAGEKVNTKLIATLGEE